MRILILFICLVSIGCSDEKVKEAYKDGDNLIETCYQCQIRGVDKFAPCCGGKKTCASYKKACANNGGTAVTKEYEDVYPD